MSRGHVGKNDRVRLRLAGLALLTAVVVGLVATSHPGTGTPAPLAGPAHGRPYDTLPIVHAAALNPTVTIVGSLTRDHRLLRVVSARGDLSGQREMTWAADTGRGYGAVRCTDNLRLSPHSQPQIQDSMLLCWRTSATRSVYTLAIDETGRPSERTSVAAIDQVWASLG